MSKSDQADNGAFNSDEFVRQNAEMAASFTKYVPHPHRGAARDEEGNRKMGNFVHQTVRADSMDRAKKNHDADLQLNMLPDVKVGTEMLIDAIMSPGDMVSSEVGIEASSDCVTSELSRALLKPIKTHFESEYDLRKKAPYHLDRALVKEGSSPVMVVPESVVDVYINGQAPLAMESLAKFYTQDGHPKPLGVLGHVRLRDEKKKPGISMESFRVAPGVDRLDQRLSYEANGALEREPNVVITDNFVAMKTRFLAEKNRKNMVSQIYQTSSGLGLESYRPRIKQESPPISDLRIERAMSQPRHFKTEMVSELPASFKANRGSIGKPMIFDLPSEAVIPLHVPGDPKSHVGYLVVLDEEGYPIRVSDHTFGQVSTRDASTIATNNSLGSNILNRVASNINTPTGGAFNIRNRDHFNAAANLYSEVFERDLISRIKNGAYNQTVRVANNEEIMRVMFARTLQSKFTQVLFVPKEYITYIAFDFHENGIGKSLLDDGAIINTARTTLMYADWLANIRNSIGRNRVTVGIDSEDPDPDATLANAQNWVARSRRIEPPTTISTPMEITDFLQQACVDWVIDSDHQGIPRMKVDVEQKNTNYPNVSSDLRDELKKMSIHLTSLSPEQVDNGLAGEFATTVVANNIRLSKRVTKYQNDFIPMLSDLVQKIIKNTPALLENILDMLAKNFDQIKYEFDDNEKAFYQGLDEQQSRKQKIFLACEAFILSLRVTLPKAPSVTLENQLAQLNTYIEALDVALNEAFMKEEALDSSIIGDASNNVAAMKAHVRALFIRRYILKTGILPELQELVAVDNEGKPQISVFDESVRHTESLVKSMVRSASKTAPLAAAATADLQRINDGEQGSAGGDAPSDNGASDDGPEAGGDGDGLDEFEM